MSADLPDLCRKQFPALSRRVSGRPAVYFDGPAGTQVPQRVADAVSHYLLHTNANHGGVFVTSRESDLLVEKAHQAVADFLGVADPHEVSFGPNMTSLTFALSRALGRTWSAGDEVIVTRLDHDANIRPWMLAARDAGATVRIVEFRHEDCTLDLDDFYSKLSPRTRLVAVGCASNATGTVNPVREMVRAAHEVGALVFLDAVHLAPHALIDIPLLGCDFLACSAYKFFGPHEGILWGRRELLEQLAAYKLRPAPDKLPGKWMTGTQSHESIVGTRAAVEYLADLGRSVAPAPVSGRRAALEQAFTAIHQYEQRLLARLIGGLADLPQITVWGIRDTARFAERLPTVSITHRSVAPRDLACRLAELGIFVWHGNYYAVEVTESLGLEPDGMVRIGLVHYNTEDEVDRLLDALSDIP